jgi:hypothetical protein
MKKIKLFEQFIAEGIQYKTLADNNIKTKDIHNWLTKVRYDVGKGFPATKAKTKEEKVAIVMDPKFQAAFINYHQQYFNSLQAQWQGVCDSNLPSRGIDAKTTKAEKEDMFDALESWISRENGILDAINELGFESFVANEIMGVYHKKPLKLKRVY